MAQGVAYCARRLGVPATVVAPENPRCGAISLGARVILVPFAEWFHTFETHTYPGVDATFIHAFDDADVMAGNGTIALELVGRFDCGDARRSRAGREREGRSHSLRRQHRSRQIRADHLLNRYATRSGPRLGRELHADVRVIQRRSGAQ